MPLTSIDINLLLSKKEINLLEAACLIADYHPKDPSSRKVESVLSAKDVLIENCVEGELAFRVDNISPYFGDLDPSITLNELDFFFFNPKSFLTWINQKSWCPDNLKNLHMDEIPSDSPVSEVGESQTKTSLDVPQELIDELTKSTNRNPEAVLAIINHVKEQAPEISPEKRAKEIARVCVLDADPYHRKHGHSAKLLLRIFLYMYAKELDLIYQNAPNKSMINRIAGEVNPYKKGGRLPTPEPKRKILWEREENAVKDTKFTLNSSSS